MTNKNESAHVVRGRDLQRFTWEHLEIADYTANIDANSSIAVIDVPNGVVHPKAYSTRCEKLYFGISGDVQFQVDLAQISVSEGDLLIVPVGAVFSYQAIGGRARLLLVHTPPYDSSAEIILGG